MKPNHNINTSEKMYEGRLKQGYGLQYPDGHVIRLFEKVIRQQLEPIQGKISLDFGCWTGVHSKYLLDKGFDVVGVDIIDGAIQLARDVVGKCAFFTITNDETLPKATYDLIFANQVMYFLPDDVFYRRLTEFYNLLTPGGLIYCSMISLTNHFAKHTGRRMANGLWEIDLRNTPLKGTHYVRFTSGLDHLKSIFSRFDPVSIGSYETVIDGVSGHHWYFIGKKRVIK